MMKTGPSSFLRYRLSRFLLCACFVAVAAAADPSSPSFKSKFKSPPTSWSLNGNGLHENNFWTLTHGVNLEEASSKSRFFVDESSGKEIQCPTQKTEDLLKDDEKRFVDKFYYNNNKKKKLILGGIVLDVMSMKSNVISQLLELCCMYSVDIYIQMPSQNLQSARQFFANAKSYCFDSNDEDESVVEQQHHCGKFQIEADPPFMKTKEDDNSRVSRIAYYRDCQREHIRTDLLWNGYSNEALENDVVVMLMDLDLHEIPSIAVMLREADKILSSKNVAFDQGNNVDVICSAGLMHRPFGYYDIFATVLESGTFVYPLSGRLTDKVMPHEDLSMIRSHELYGRFTQEGMLEYFLQQSNLTDGTGGLVPVQSCFGGFALYRASTWLLNDCTYTMAYGDDLMAYSNKNDGRPCEHVILHSCINKNYSHEGHPSSSSSRIFVQPHMITSWDEPFESMTYIVSGGIIAHGLVHQEDGLILSRRFPSKGSRAIENGNYTLRITPNGNLVVEESAGPQHSQPHVKWSSATTIDKRRDKIEDEEAQWDFMFLTLSDDGILTLSKQRPGPCSLDDLCFQQIGATDCNPCRSVLWTNNQGPMAVDYSKNVSGDSSSKMLLHLDGSGVLRIIDMGTGEVTWSSSEESLGNLEFETDSIKRRKTITSLVSSKVQHKNENIKTECIPSGNEESINRVLATGGVFAEAVLCPNSVFYLHKPIVYTDIFQSVYTEGCPTDDSRAILRVVDASTTTAVNMLRRDNALLSHVIVDGNQPLLGMANDPKQYGMALIRAGYESQGAVIRYVSAFGSRSWSVLHLGEGDPSNRCSGAIVEYNTLGKSGIHFPGKWSDGISMACSGSIIRNNTIEDATDVGLVVFGAPGSIVEDNVIIAKTRIMGGGITLVDYDPWGGDFSGTVVQRNIIIAQGAVIGVGLGMGSRGWAACEDKSRPLRGATVQRNVLRGEHMMYGYVIDGVVDWKAIHNVDEAQHRGRPGLACNGAIASAPSGFQIDRSYSQGIFQKEFQSSIVSLVGAVSANGNGLLETRTVPCIPPPENNQVAREGLFFSKIPKTAGTTVAGIARRIVARRQSQLGSRHQCTLQAGHGSPRFTFNYASRSLSNSFLLSFVRGPNEQALSSYYYHEVAKRGANVSDASFLEWASHFQGNYQSRFLQLRDSVDSIDAVEHILDSYDFIGVVERFEESLVLLALVLELELSDVLYLSSKSVTTNAYAFTGDGNGNFECIQLVPKEYTPAMSQYFSSDIWIQNNKIDFALHQAASKRLDDMIEKYGKDRFEIELDAFRHLQDVTQQICPKHARFPCASNGTLDLVGSNCYERDEGYGHACIDAVSEMTRGAVHSFTGEINTIVRNIEARLQLPQHLVSKEADHVSKYHVSNESSSINEPEQGGNRNESHDEKLAWLLSFPNSGTTYTHEVVSKIAEVRVATNYGKECLCIETASNQYNQSYLCANEDREKRLCRSVLSRPGPYWLRTDLRHPKTGFALVKTHCGGYSFYVESDESLISREQYIDECSLVLSDINERISYADDTSLIQRAVHIFRDPFDNIVSRFHHWRQSAMNGSARGLYAKNRAGFRMFCQSQANKTVELDTLHMLHDETFKDVPCYFDFIKYIHWHNLACKLQEDFKIPSLAVHYESYGTNWNETMTSLLDFLELPPLNFINDFQRGKRYRHYYTQHEVRAIESMLKKLASKQTWAHLKHYFLDELQENLSTQEIIDVPAIPLCTFEMIHEAFKVKDALRNASQGCWRAHDEILRIPPSAIMNREKMRFIGRGSKGVVHEAILQLNADSDKVCACAIKTDKCQNHVTNERFVSCIHPDAVQMAGTESFMQSEYIGAMVFAASRKVDVDLNGLLSTWGVIVEESSKPHEIRGAIMPILNFETLEHIAKSSDSNYNQRKKLPDAMSQVEVAHWIKPAVEALSFVEELGLSFQDVKEKNIGVLQDSPEEHAFVFDNTFLSFLDGDSCKFDGSMRAACNFCVEDIPLPKHRQPNYTKEMIRRKDGHGIISMILNLLSPIPTHTNSSELSRSLDQLLFSGVDFKLNTVLRILEATDPYLVPHVLLNETSDETSANMDLQQFRISELHVGSRQIDENECAATREGNVSSWLPFTVLPNVVEKIPIAVENDGRNHLLLTFEAIRLWEKGHNYSEFSLDTRTKVLHDGSFLSILPVGESQIFNSSSLSSPALTVKLKPRYQRDWLEHVIELPIHLSSYQNGDFYVANNGTVTMVIDTCMNEVQTPGGGQAQRCFTILEASRGDDGNYAAWSIVGKENILAVPMNCSIDPMDPHFACPCNIEEPTIWYDKPMGRWRMLFSQYPSLMIDGRCVLDRDKEYRYIGGYAESLGSSASGHWRYDYFRSGYSSDLRFSPVAGERAVEVKNLGLRRRPRVVLNPDDGGLDGGYLVNEICSKGHEDCFAVIQEVSRSKMDELENNSGTIFVVYHAETIYPIYPLGIGELGIARAHHTARLFDGTYYPVPSNIIAAQIFDHSHRGQRLEGSIMPLAQNIDIDIRRGPVLLDTPNWDPKKAKDYARMTLSALKEGPVVISYWSYINEFCHQLGAECDDFVDHGEMVIIEVQNGIVQNVTRAFDQFVSSDNGWDFLPPSVQKELQVLGYNEATWSEPNNSIYNREWDSLNTTELKAATRLGLNETFWDQGCFEMAWIALDSDEYVPCFDYDLLTDMTVASLLTEGG